MKRKLQKQADELNGIIHSRNLYSNGRRYVNACVVKDGSGAWVLAVTDLHSETLVPVAGKTFVDGYGQEVSPAIAAVTRSSVPARVFCPPTPHAASHQVPI